MKIDINTILLAVCTTLGLLSQVAQVSAFGAGNIASIAAIEGKNYRHGDIEDTLKTVAFLKNHKWSSSLVKKVYFGNWLRDYSQAVDVGTLKGTQASSIRILVWMLAFLSFGYATGSYEVTEEKLGCYRPEEHIDNPKGYSDGEDARKLDPRLRGPVQPEELLIDPETGMANYIANEKGGWATSSGYIKWCFARSLHFGRLYTHGPNKGDEKDLDEALRCLGQGLHTLEDYPAHSNYVQLVLRELGFHNVFPHVGSSTQLNLRGKGAFPIVTGTFGSVDFLLSVIGEASDHVTQSQVDEMEKAFNNSTRSGHQQGADDLVNLLSQVPGTSGLCSEARSLQAASEADSSTGERAFGVNSVTEMAKTDPQKIVDKIYPVLVFRDKIVRTIDSIISKIPGLEAVVEKITETLTLFVMRLLSPYIMPLIAMASKGLKTGTTGIVSADASQQYAVFDDPSSIAPSHSILSNDHFYNVLNEPAGKVACEIVRYVAPRIIYGWDHPEVPTHEILDDVVQVLHHPVLRKDSELHRAMFGVVQTWSQEAQRQGKDLNRLLSAASIRASANHHDEAHGPKPSFAAWTNLPNLLAGKNREIDLEDADSGPALPSRRDDHQSQYSQSQSQSGYGQTQYQAGYGQPPSGPAYGNQGYVYPPQPTGDPWAGNQPYQGHYQGQAPSDSYGRPPQNQGGYQQGPPGAYGGGYYPGQDQGQNQGQGYYR